MPEQELKLTLTIPERSDAPNLPAAIGLAEAVRQKGSENPFDLGQALTRAASASSGLRSATVPPQPASELQTSRR